MAVVPVTIGIMPPEFFIGKYNAFALQPRNRRSKTLLRRTRTTARPITPPRRAPIVLATGGTRTGIATVTAAGIGTGTADDATDHAVPSEDSAVAVAHAAETALADARTTSHNLNGAIAASQSSAAEIQHRRAARKVCISHKSLPFDAKLSLYNEHNVIAGDSRDGGRGAYATGGGSKGREYPPDWTCPRWGRQRDVMISQNLGLADASCHPFAAVAATSTSLGACSATDAEPRVRAMTQVRHRLCFSFLDLNCCGTAPSGRGWWISKPQFELPTRRQQLSARWRRRWLPTKRRRWLPTKRWRRWRRL